MKKALIFGVTGQDGAYLAKLLLDKGYEVHGVKRRSSSFNTGRIDELYSPPMKEKQFFLHFGDVTDSLNIFSLINKIRPDEIYNLSAMSHVRVSFDIPEYTANVDALGTIRILEAIRASGLAKSTKYYQASTSELFGKVQEIPQTEKTPFYPRSPYAVAKLYAFWAVVNYREAYNIFACNGILFNHESPLRGETFVTRKITMAVSRIASGSQEVLALGNLDSKRDWGYAPEYVEGMWLMMQQQAADDFVLATGRTCSVREFLILCFKHVNIKIEWKGQPGSVNEIGVDKATGRKLIEIDPIYFRATEVDILIGDASKAHKVLGWKSKTELHELVRIMMEAEILDNELKIGIKTKEYYHQFTKEVENHRHELFNLLTNIKSNGGKIAGLGASTKGNVVLQYCDLDEKIISCVGEVNPYKFGRFTPGTHIPIVSEDDLKKTETNYKLILPWHFRKTFLEREKEFLKNGGKLIFALPKIEVYPNE